MLPWHAFAQTSPSSSADDSKPRKSSTIDFPESRPEANHPWFESAPSGMSKLIALGNVRFGTDDERLRKARKQAFTFFRIKASYRYKYTQQDGRLEDDDPSQWVAVIDAKLRMLDIHLEHDVYLQSGWQATDPWDTALLKHEFDHVAISTDPRFRQFLKQLLQQPIECTVRWPRDEQLTSAIIDQAINAEMAARIHELERLVQAQYDRLDQASRDGRNTIEDREQFFHSLYSLDSIRECHFLYLDTVKPLVQDRPSKEVREHFSLLMTP